MTGLGFERLLQLPLDILGLRHRTRDELGDASFLLGFVDRIIDMRANLIHCKPKRFQNRPQKSRILAIWKLHNVRNTVGQGRILDGRFLFPHYFVCLESLNVVRFPSCLVFSKKALKIKNPYFKNKSITSKIARAARGPSPGFRRQCTPSPFYAFRSDYGNI